MQLKIGALDFLVLPADAVEMGGEYEGTCNCQEQLIRIRCDRSPQWQASVLVHELLHAAFNLAGLPTKGLTEEAVCSALEGPLALVLRDNHWLFDRLYRALSFNEPLF